MNFILSHDSDLKIVLSRSKFDKYFVNSFNNNGRQKINSLCVDQAYLYSYLLKFALTDFKRIISISSIIIYYEAQYGDFLLIRLKWTWYFKLGLMVHLWLKIEHTDLHYLTKFTEGKQYDILTPSRITISRFLLFTILSGYGVRRNFMTHIICFVYTVCSQYVPLDNFSIVSEASVILFIYLYIHGCFPVFMFNLGIIWVTNDTRGKLVPS